MIKISSIKTVNMFLPGNVYNGFRKFWQYCQNWNLQTLALFSFSSFITFFPQNIEEKVPLETPRYGMWHIHTHRGEVRLWLAGSDAPLYAYGCIAFFATMIYFEIPLVAFRINWAISVGWETSEAWLEGSAIVVAFICFANIRSRAGGITWSS
jgi:hypothetical protein